MLLVRQDLRASSGRDRQAGCGIFRPADEPALLLSPTLFFCAGYPPIGGRAAFAMPLELYTARRLTGSNSSRGKPMGGRGTRGSFNKETIGDQAHPEVLATANSTGLDAGRHCHGDRDFKRCVRATSSWWWPWASPAAHRALGRQKQYTGRGAERNSEQLECGASRNSGRREYGAERNDEPREPDDATPLRDDAAVPRSIVGA